MIPESKLISYASNFLESEIEKITDLIGKEITSYNDVKLLCKIRRDYELDLKELLGEREVENERYKV